jgi:hypothetical protein
MEITTKTTGIRTSTGTAAGITITTGTIGIRLTMGITIKEQLLPGSLLLKNATETDKDASLRCSSFTPEREEHLAKIRGLQKT